MPDHADHLHYVIDSTWRCCSYLRGWFCGLVSRHFLELVGPTLEISLPKVIQLRKGQHSTSMAAIEPIDISSSESDIEIGDFREAESNTIRGSENSRRLPSWAFTGGPKPRSTGYDGWSQKEAYTSNGSSSSATRHPPPRIQEHSLTDEGRNSNRKVHGVGDSGYSMTIGFPRTVNSSIATSSGSDYERISSQQALKRTLPLSLQPSSLITKTNNSLENIRTGLACDNYENSYYLSGTTFGGGGGGGGGSGYGKGYMRDQLSRGGDDLILYENNGSRLLPPSLMHGKSSSSAQFGTSDPLFRSGVEERISTEDERLIYQAALEDLNQPKVEVDVKDGLLSVSLLRHQKIALAWMLQKETRSLHCLGGILADDQGLGKTVSMIALIQMQMHLQAKSKSENSCNPKTEALNLDDEDDNGSVGLDNGKTEADKDKETTDVKPNSEVSTSSRAFSRRRPAAGTLVVCPASVLRQWARELDDKVMEEAKLRVLIYHGGSRTRDPQELAKYDVVLTTYSIVTNEVPKQPLVEEDEVDEKDGEKFGLSSEFSFSKKRKKVSNNGKKGKRGRKGVDGSAVDYESGPLAKVGWFRVVLDEAQTIKNHRTQVARACCSLRAKRRWCLSGTPIQNTIDDLYSYFRFLKYDPYAVYKSFYHTIKMPISRSSITGYKKLQAVLRAIMLRRTKETLIDGEPIIKLPPKTIRLTKVDFSSEERAFYSQLEAESRLQFKEYAAAGTVNQNYANILLLLLRLRQACDHPLLVQGHKPDCVGKESMTMAKRLPRDMLINLFALLETSTAICQVCDDPPENAVATMCGHVFCYQCVSDYLTGDENTCPAPSCKEQLGPDVVFSRATLRTCISDYRDDGSYNPEYDEKSIVLKHEYNSSKIKAVLEILQSLSGPDAHGFMSSFPHEFSYGESSNVTVSRHTTVYSDLPIDGPLKAIIFSQWTGMLDLVENSLNQNCIQYRRLDGTMSLAARDRAVKDFNTDPEIMVMLMSLKAGNLGLNMVAACHVILLDLWWNPTTEDQAVDRAHRIGQTRPVTVTRLTIKNTVEDRILSLQEEKRKMVASAFGEDQGGGTATRLTVEDLKYLFMV